MVLMAFVVFNVVRNLAACLLSSVITSDVGFLIHFVVFDVFGNTTTCTFCLVVFATTAMSVYMVPMAFVILDIMCYFASSFLSAIVTIVI